MLEGQGGRKGMLGRGGGYSEARGRDAAWLLLEIPTILMQLEGRGPAKVGYEG